MNTANPSPTESTVSSRSSGRYFLKLGVPLLVLGLLVLGGLYWYAQSITRSKFQQQLAAVYAGPIQIGSTSLGSDGATAYDVKLFREGEQNPVATIDTLKAKAPLQTLLAGDAPLEELQVKGLHWNLNLDEDGQPPELPLVESDGPLELPAKRISLERSQLTVSQPGRRPIAVDNIRGEITPSDSGASLSATARWNDSHWELAGDLGQDSLDLQASSQKLLLESEKLQGLPWISPAVLEPLIFRGPVIAKMEWKQSAQQPVQLTGHFQPHDFYFEVPRLGVKAEQLKADVLLENSLLTVQSSEANVGGGTVNVTGTTRLDLPQASGQFEAELNGVAVDSLRTLGSIPKPANGKLTGKGSGDFQVGGDAGFQLSLQALGSVEQATYEDIQLNQTDVDLKIAELRLANESFGLQNLAGTLELDTNATQVDIHKFLVNFGLINSADQRLARMVGGKTDAVVELEIPLAEADNLHSWSLKATTSEGTVSVADQQIQNVQSIVQFKEGDISISRLEGVGSHSDQTSGGDSQLPENADDTNAHRIYVTGKWPLPKASPTDAVDNLPQDPATATEIDSETQDDQTQDEAPQEQEPQKATFQIQGQQVSVAWLLSIAKDYDPDLANLLAEASGEGPTPIDGHVTVNADLSIPTDTPSDFAKWGVQCEIVSGDIQLADTKLSGINGRFQLENQVAKVVDLKATLNDRDPLNVSATIPLNSAADAKVDAQLPSVPVSLLVAAGKKWSPEFREYTQQWATADQFPIQGNLSINVQLQRAAADAQDQPWTADIKFDSRTLSIKDKAVQSLAGQFQLDSQQIEIPQLDLQFEDGSSLKTKGQWPLQSNAPGEVQTEILRVPIKWVLDLVPDGQQKLGQWDQRIQNAMAFQQETASPEEDSLAPFSQAVGDTLVSGQFRLSKPADQNKLQVDAKLLTPGLQWNFGRGNFQSDPLNANLSGEIDASNLAASQLTLNVDPHRAQVGDQSIENLRATVRLKQRLASFDFSAGFLDGQVTAEGAIPLDATAEAAAKPIFIQATELRIRPGVAAFTATPFQQLDGTLDGELKLTLTDEGYGISDGQLHVSNLFWQQVLMSQHTDIDFTVLDNVITVSRFRGDLAQGYSEGNLRFALNNSFAGDYELILRRVSLDELLRPLRGPYPQTAEIGGRLSTRLRGTLGTIVDGSGFVGLSNGDVFGLQATSLKLPINLRLDTNSLAGKVEMRQSQFRAFDGSITGKASASFGRRLDIDVDASFRRVSSDELIGVLAGDSNLGQGELYGDLKLSGRSVRSLRDLQGSFQGRLERSRSFQIPLLRNMAIFLNSGQLLQKQFDSDEIVLRLAKGILKVERMTFASDAAQLLITGQVTTDGRMDLDVAARIANLSGNRQLYEQISGSPITALATPAGAAVTQVTEFLSNRVIYLHAGGTVRQPNFRLETARLIRDELVARYLFSGNRNLLSNLSSSQ